QTSRSGNPHNPHLTPAGTPGGMGLGLANTRARLKQLYGANAELRIESHPDGGAVVTLVLPFREAR
ncbi:MAG TPA: ATP-binding protein, partial [Steroidobacteraceae bacterium]|nr:ATP-binding protein [Steroidobacteraceae bacterium]